MLAVVALAVGGCSGPTVSYIEETYPTMSDLEIPGATRVSRSTRCESLVGTGGEQGVFQRYEPDGATPEEVLEDAVAIAEVQGWALENNEDLDRWCGSEDRTD